MISPVLTGVKENESDKSRKKLDLNINERSVASITDDNTLLDAPNTGTRMTATKISQQDQPLNHDPSKDRQIIGNSVGISTDEEDEENTYGMLGKTQILSINENSETNL